jgi:hypothetical protein
LKRRRRRRSWGRAKEEEGKKKKEKINQISDQSIYKPLRKIVIKRYGDRLSIDLTDRQTDQRVFSIIEAVLCT